MVDVRLGVLVPAPIENIPPGGPAVGPEKPPNPPGAAPWPENPPVAGGEAPKPPKGVAVF